MPGIHSTLRSGKAAVELVRGLYNLRAQHRPCALTIGAFDGIHLGHQQMLQALRERARANGLATAVLSFEPTPREYFAREASPPRLTRFRERFVALANAGVERFICLRFDEQVRSLSAADFMQRILVDALDARQVVVGHDFRFGSGGSGEVQTLRDFGARAGFAVTEIAPVRVGAERVSSSLIRQALSNGELNHAARLLGRPYSMLGKVIHGARLGRQLGYPTANLRLHRRATPLQGIFAVRVTGAGLQQAPAVASLGTRPAVGGQELLLEVHVFDFQGDLYRQVLEVEFIARLREERNFPDLDALVAQIHLDAAQAREILKSAPIAPID